MGYNTQLQLGFLATSGAHKDLHHKSWTGESKQKHWDGLYWWRIMSHCISKEGVIRKWGWRHHSNTDLQCKNTEVVKHCDNVTILITLIVKWAKRTVVMASPVNHILPSLQRPKIFRPGNILINPHLLSSILLQQACLALQGQQNRQQQRLRAGKVAAKQQNSSLILLGPGDETTLDQKPENFEKELVNDSANFCIFSLISFITITVWCF